MVNNACASQTRFGRFLIIRLAKSSMLFVIQSSLLSILHGIMFGTDIVNFVTYLLFYTCLKYLFCFVPSSWVIAIHRFCINSSSLGISFGCNGDIYFLLFAFWQDSCMALTSLPLRLRCACAAPMPNGAPWCTCGNSSYGLFCVGAYDTVTQNK